MSPARSKLLFPPHQAQASLSACISSLSLETCSCKLSMLTCFPTVSIARGREQNARGLRALNETFSHFNSVAGTRVLVSLPKATNRLLLDLQESVLTSLSRARQQSRLCWLQRILELFICLLFKCCFEVRASIFLHMYMSVCIVSLIACDAYDLR